MCWLAWLYLRIWAGPGRVRSAPVCPCLAPCPPAPRCSLAPAQARLGWPVLPDCSQGWPGWAGARRVLVPGVSPGLCLLAPAMPGPGHCPPDTRLACDVILPPRLSQLESAPCLQQTRASHKPVYCDPSVQHTPAVCSQTRSRAAAPAVISWINVIQPAM